MKLNATKLLLICALSPLMCLSIRANAADAPTLRGQYRALMGQYAPSDKTAGQCQKPDILHNEKTRRYRTVLASRFKETPPQANFCGKYYLFNEPITGGGDVYLADCNTGKVVALQEDYASNAPLISIKSCLLVEAAPQEGETKDNFEETAYGPPQLYHFNKSKLEKINDPIWPQK